MIALKIVKNGSFMSKILAGDAFDSFLLEEARIRMAVTWDIDGHLNEQFYPADVWKDPEQRPYDRTQWKEIRPYIYDIIKGKQAPSSFHFVRREPAGCFCPELSDYGPLQRFGHDHCNGNGLQIFHSGQERRYALG